MPARNRLESLHKITDLADLVADLPRGKVRGYVDGYHSSRSLFRARTKGIAVEDGG